MNGIIEMEHDEMWFDDLNWINQSQDDVQCSACEHFNESVIFLH
jgi:hypothetical protein